MKLNTEQTPFYMTARSLSSYITIKESLLCFEGNYLLNSWWYSSTHAIKPLQVLCGLVAMETVCDDTTLRSVYGMICGWINTLLMLSLRVSCFSFTLWEDTPENHNRMQSMKAKYQTLEMSVHIQLENQKYLEKLLSKMCRNFKLACASCCRFQ